MAVKADALHAASRSAKLLNWRWQEALSVYQGTNHSMCHIFIPYAFVSQHQEHRTELCGPLHWASMAVFIYFSQE